MTFDDRLCAAFLAVAHYGSIGRAAEALNLSQPTLSRMIKRLEQSLKAPLFDRFASGVTLNAYGEALLPFIDRIDIEAAHATDEIERLRTGSIGVLRIGSAPSVGISMLPRIFREMTEQNALLKIELMEGVWDVLEPALLNRKIDIFLATELPENDDIQRLDTNFVDMGSVLASPSHPIRSKPSLMIADLADLPWIMPPEGSVPRRTFAELVRTHSGRMPRVAIETWSVSMMKALVANSGFVSWLPRSLCAVEEKAGLIAPIDVPGLTLPMRMYAYRRKRGLVPPAVRRFLELLSATPN